jgi:hypothetical protein
MIKRKASILAVGLIVIALLLVFSTAMFIRIVHDQKSLQRNIDNTQAFWLADSAFSQAALNWRQNGNLTNINITSMGTIGQYEFKNATVPYANSNSTTRRIYIAYGYVPNAAAPRATRRIELYVPMFPDGNYALITDDNITVSGSSNTIRGDVLYGGNLTGTLNVEAPGTQAIQDPNFNFELLNFTYLKAQSKLQGNYFNGNFTPNKSPASFWYNNITNGTPNIVYLDNQTLDLKGNDQIRGFVVVGGNTTYDATIVGNSQIDGCLYTLGDFIDKGGGSRIDVNGTIWAGGNADLKGSVDLNFNVVYYQAMKILIGRGMHVTWRDLDNPYQL